MSCLFMTFFHNREIFKSVQRRNVPYFVAPHLLRALLFFLLVLPSFITPVLYVFGSHPGEASAQTLDDAIQNQLGADCLVLTGGGSRPFLSSELNSICAGGNSGGGPGSSGGGGTGSGQTLGVTVENRRHAQLEGSTDKTAQEGFSFNLGKGIGLFVTFDGESLNRDRTTFGDGFDSTVLGTTVGGDYRIANIGLIGGAFSFVNRDGDFDAGGDFDTNSYGGILYGSVLPIPQVFLDLTVGYTYHDYENKRNVSFTESSSGDNISGIAKSDSHANEFLVQALLGYDYTFNKFTIGPRVGLNYSRLWLNTYNEKDGGGLALKYEDQQVTSLQSTLGLVGSMAVSTSYGVWVPQINGEYVHEFENDQRSITVNFVGDMRSNPQKFKFQSPKPVRNFFNVGVGTSLYLANGIQPFVFFQAMVGNEQFNSYGGSLGIRIEGS